MNKGEYIAMKKPSIAGSYGISTGTQTHRQQSHTHAYTHTRKL